MKDKKWIVYEHESPSNKVYVGITCQNPDKRWKNGYGYVRKDNHLILFANAILKYGWDNFKHRIVGRNLTLREAQIAECLGIQYYKSLNRSYNLTNGGDGWEGRNHTEDTKRKIGSAHKGKKLDQSHILKAVTNRIKNYSYIVLAVKDGEIKQFTSSKEAAEALGIKTRCNISACISGKQCLVKGYVFMHWDKSKQINKDEVLKYVNNKLNKRYIKK